MEGAMEKLSFDWVKTKLAGLSGWALNDAGEISKTYTLAGFPQALMFVTAAGVLAEAAQHHPDITIRWNKVTLALSTHDAGGLTDLDFDLARQIDNLPNKF
jgi:4a-hydroxytetrahydrobiopterin dehydratase